MATAGSGDVLTGITAAMLFAVPQGQEAGHKAAQAAAYIHAMAGEVCADALGERAMIASDMSRALSEVFGILTKTDN